MYKHSVVLDKRRCVGCTSCIKNCPTEAIRVQMGKAKILEESCIDCGRCIVVCPHHAMVSVTTPLDALNDHKCNIAVVASTFYTQFQSIAAPEEVYSGLYSLGFDSIYEEARAYEILAEALRKHLRSDGAALPVISTSCPVVPRLVTMLYPNLIDNLSPFLPSNEIAARIAKREFCEMYGVDETDVGVYYISPCPAGMAHISAPLGTQKSEIDGIFAVRDVYAKLVKTIESNKEKGLVCSIPFPAGAFGLGTAVIGGLCSAVGTEHYLAVDGIDNVCQCLDELENERITGLHLLEPLVCGGGCVGGPLNFENQFVAKNRARRIANSQPRLDPEHDEHVQKYVDSALIRYDTPFEPQSILCLSDDVAEAARMMDELERVNRQLPGLDCGSCGSPTCRTLAEDIVRGFAVEMDCIFKLRDKVRIMAQEMVDLAEAHKRG
ncbi:MAG: [Fe-Fe] hydrogenase large subunit C-terminal domain-containing protein [Clostridiaceae bacterium]|nr:4Fe-4S binding protein [Eubacteriales bacterium]